jgi:hypothetical protein
MHGGIRKKWHCWVGYRHPLSRDPEVIRCAFVDGGFEQQGGQPFQPCKKVYHLSCTLPGTPFTMWQKDGLGLNFLAVMGC